MKDAVIVTGAAGDIGQALCHEFSNENFFVIAVDRHKILDEWTDYQVVVDLKDLVDNPSKMDELYREIFSILEGQNLRLRTLVSNTAIQIVNPFDNITLSKFQSSLSVNLTAPFLLSRAFIHDLEQAEGNIVNISSIHTKLTKPGFISYATSKSALQGLSRAMAVDLGSRVRINCIQPAAIRTRMLEGGFKDNSEKPSKLNEYHPMGRIGESDDIAKAAFWLSSDDSSFVTSSTINLDSGIGSRLHD